MYNDAAYCQSRESKKVLVKHGVQEPDRSLSIAQLFLVRRRQAHDMLLDPCLPHAYFCLSILYVTRCSAASSLTSATQCSPSSASREIHSQCPAGDHLSPQLLHRSLRRPNVREVRMRKTPWLARSPVNCHPNIDHILDLPEEVVQVAVTHVEGHVANEEGLGRGIHGASALIAAISAAGTASTGATDAAKGVLHGEAAAFKVLEVVELNGFGGRFDGVELYVAKAVAMKISD